VTWGGLVLPDGYDRTSDQVVCDVQSGKTLATLSTSSIDTHFAFFPDGRRIIGSDSFLRIWDADAGSAGAWFDTVSIWNGDTYDLT
jgi:hypothetical protein